jgi:molecular chaperone GrpE
VRDLLEPSSVLSSRLRHALERAGVDEYAPVGEHFDPDVHEAVERVPTDEPTRADLVASVQRVGYADRSQLIRVPHVVVYQLEPHR